MSFESHANDGVGIFMIFNYVCLETFLGQINFVAERVKNFPFDVIQKIFTSLIFFVAHEEEADKPVNRHEQHDVHIEK